MVQRQLFPLASLRHVFGLRLSFYVQQPPCSESLDWRASRFHSRPLKSKRNSSRYSKIQIRNVQDRNRSCFSMIESCESISHHIRKKGANQLLILRFYFVAPQIVHLYPVTTVSSYASLSTTVRVSYSAGCSIRSPLTVDELP